MTAPFRDAIREMSPRWLRGYWGERLLYPFGAIWDALVDGATAAVKIRFPGLYSNESLPLIARERGIRQGLGETVGAFTARLLNWWYDHQRSANPYTLLRQLRAYLTPFAVPITIVNNNGTRYTVDAGGVLGYSGPNPSSWNWDGNTAAWSRFWILLYPPNTLWVPQGTWGDGTSWGDPDTTWGSTATPEQVQTIQAIIYDWTAPHSRSYVVIIFDQAAFEAAPPDGTWDRWANRNPAAVYADGVE